MRSIQEIKELKDYYVNDLYLDVRSEQETDRQYIDDTFDVPEIKDPHKVLRSGIGYEAVSAPAEQIITSNPQIFFKSNKKEDKEAITRLSVLVNGVWIPTIKRSIPNLFKEIVKNKLSRGESYIRLIHNETWVTGKRNKIGLAVLFLCPDPMCIYGSPEEDNCGWLPNVGVPNEVILYFERQPSELMIKYPNWGNPMGRKLKNEKPDEKRELVEWWEYWSKDQKYFEADGQAVLEGGIQPNIYGFTPFVRKYSGFGKRSPSGELADLIVSDIRQSRDLIKEECSIRSDISSILHIFSHKPVTITIPSGEEIDIEGLKRGLDLGAYHINILPLPPASEIHWGDTILPTPEVFQHLRDIRAEIRERHPFTMAGFPLGSSGRQQDLSASAAMRRYESIIENTEDEVATSIQMALKICSLPGLRPELLESEDLDKDLEIEVRLKAKDPIEEDRLATLGARLHAQGIIDHETDLIKYQGYTQDEAEEILTNILVEKVTYQSPEIAELLGLKAAEKAGMADELELLKQRRLQIEQSAKSLTQMPAPTTLQRQVGETQTDQGREMIDMALVARGARRPPQPYTRGG